MLAAGLSARLGRPKQLLDYRGRPLVQHAIDAAATLDEIIVVVGHAAAEVQRSVTLPAHGRIVANPAYAEGMATSLTTGLAAASEGAEAAVVVLADQPGVTAAHVNAIVDAFHDTRRPVVRATYGGAPGHPVLLARTVWPDVMAVEGDTGARDLLRGHPDWVTDLPLGEAAPLDVDTDDDYRRLLGEESA